MMRMEIFKSSVKTMEIQMKYNSLINIQIHAKKNNFLFFIFFIFIVSCNKKTSVSFETFIINDSVTVKGYKENDLRFGIWEYIDKNGDLLEVVEFKIINNESCYNQAINLNKKDTVYEKTSFYKFNYINDSLLNIKFYSLFDKYFETANMTILLYSDKINEDFSNLDRIKLDTLYFSENIIKFKIKSPKFKGVIQELHLKNDSSFFKRNVYVDINKNSKNFPNK